MNKTLKSAAKLHENVPPDWYYASMKRNLLQKWWHVSRFKEVERQIEPVEGKILDIGCADGMFTKVIFDTAHPSEIVGIDVLKDSVMWAQKHWKKNKKMKFKLGNAHDLKFKDKSFDAVFILEVMEHVSDPKKVLSEINRVLRKDGYLIALVPSDNGLFKIIWWFVTKFWWAKIWDDCHVQSFNSGNTLSKNIKNAGFKIEVDKYFWLGMLNVVRARKQK